jgi:hypothetical protein
MAKRIRLVKSTVPALRPAGAGVPRLDPAVVASALGAEPGPEGRGPGPLGPITLFAVREALLRRRQSSGGRPGLEGATLRAKIPLSDREWGRLEDLASALSATGFSPSAGQVASVLLSMALESVTERLAREPGRGDDLAAVPLARELATKATSMPS